jgi:hypothetical protein
MAGKALPREGNFLWAAMPSTQKIGILSELQFSGNVQIFSYSYTGLPSDLNRLIRFPPLPELPETDDSV